MDYTVDPSDASDASAPLQVNKVDVLRPFTWLALGARDLLHCPRASFGLGAMFAAAGVVLVIATWRAIYLAPALLGGFLLVAPILAVSLYALSRQRAEGEAASFVRARRAWRANASSIALFGLVLAITYLFWERLAAIVFALFYKGQPLHVARWPQELLHSGENGALIAGLLALGAGVAAIVFALSVVSVPLLVDRRVDAVTAALTSLRCCSRNPGAMILWAALIACLTVLGFATFMLGLVVVFPLLAHASWHACREMVSEPRGER